MARKNPKKKPKGSAVEAPPEGQKSQKVSSETKGKKRSPWKNQADIPGHVLDQDFLVRVNASWNGWQYQLVAVLAPPLYNYSNPPQTFRGANGVQPG